MERFPWEISIKKARVADLPPPQLSVWFDFFQRHLGMKRKLQSCPQMGYVTECIENTFLCLLLLRSQPLSERPPSVTQWANNVFVLERMTEAGRKSDRKHVPEYKVLSSITYIPVQWILSIVCYFSTTPHYPALQYFFSCCYDIRCAHHRASPVDCYQWDPRGWRHHPGLAPNQTPQRQPVLPLCLWHLLRQHHHYR